MVVLTCLREARDILTKEGQRDWEIIVTYDTRPVTGNKSKPYFDCLNELKEQWASGQGLRRIYLSLFNAELFDGIPDVWAKVHIMSQVLKWLRVAFAAWCDSDASIVPYYAPRAKACQARNPNTAEGQVRRSAQTVGRSSFA